MVIALSAERDEPALTGNRQAGVVGPDHRLALSLSVRRPVPAAWCPARISSAQAERRCAPSACPPSPAPAPSAWVQRCHGPVELRQAAPPCWEKHRTPRSEERRAGQECVSRGRSRWSPYHEKQKQINKKQKKT